MKVIIDNQRIQLKYLEYQEKAKGKSKKTMKKIKHSLHVFDTLFNQDYKYFNEKVAIKL